jgi:hypothetical protein
MFTYNCGHDHEIAELKLALYLYPNPQPGHGKQGADARDGGDGSDSRTTLILSRSSRIQWR